MAVSVEPGEYAVGGQRFAVNAAAELAVDPPDRLRVTGEEHVLTDEPPNAFHGGTMLEKTCGPVDTFTRLPYAIVPDSVKVRSGDGTLYVEGKDYSLDRTWGGIARIPAGSIPEGAAVNIDYEVFLQRMDAVQVSARGVASIRRGKSAAVCPEPPAPGKGCRVLAHVYVPYRAESIASECIYPLPEKPLTWRDFIKVTGHEHLSRTRGLLLQSKPVTVVCWGDSVTWGLSPSSRDKCYVELFRARLQAAHPASRITLINAGIGGSNTESRRDGFDKEVLSHKPDLITVEFVNDVGRSPEQVYASFTDFIARARQANPGVEFVILTPHFMMPEWMSNFDKSVPAMRRAAQESRVALGDTALIWANLRRTGIPYEVLLANAINHPNDLGHEFFAETLMRALREGR